MSKEFESVVLEKLDYLSIQINSNNQKIEKVEAELKDTKQELRNFAKDTNKRFEKIETEFGKFAKNTNERFEKIEANFVKTNQKITDLSQRFTVFDFEINRKIDTLFDSDTVNKDNIVSLNVKNYNHDTRITNLENRDLNIVAKV